MPDRRRIRAGGFVAALVVAGAVVVGAGAGEASAACPSSRGRPIKAAPDPVPRAQIVFRGHGSGHGLGMSQYGAQGAARLGCSYRQILTRYYSGTRVRVRPMPSVVTVRMTENTSSATVTRVTGAVDWRNGRRRIHLQRSGTVTVRWLSATRAALRTGGRRIWAGRVAAAGLSAIHRRGIVRLDAPVDPYLKLPMELRWDRITFHVDEAGMDVVKLFGDNRQGRAMDKYLLGLAEIPPSWPRAALRAQAVAARTYAVVRGGALLPTVAHQNYNGYEYEKAAGPRWRAAVWATSRQVVVDGSGHTIDAVYSSSMAGFTEDKVYSWGGSPIAYLRPVNDARWTRASDNPASTLAWSRGFSRRVVARALGFGRVTDVFVYPRGDRRRAQGVRVTGFRDGRRVTEWIPGFDVRNALGLPSPGFVVQVNR